MRNRGEAYEALGMSAEAEADYAKASELRAKSQNVQN